MRKWIYHANPKYYNISDAFSNEENLIWPMRSKVSIGDLVYFYISAPEKQIKYLCEVTDIELNNDNAFEKNSKYIIKKAKYKKAKNFICLKLIKDYDEEKALSLDTLKTNGLKERISAPINLHNNKFLMYYLETFQ